MAEHCNSIKAVENGTMKRGRQMLASLPADGVDAGHYNLGTRSYY